MSSNKNKRLQIIEEYVQGSLKNMNDISQNKNEVDFNKYVYAIQLDFESIKKDLLELKHNKIVKEKQNEVIEEKLDLLKIIKANKEEVEEALADKPDTYALNKKVSHSQFNAVCDDFVRTLNEAITKLSQQESLCQQSICELRCEFEGKLDELEIPTLKDFIKNELQALKNQIRLLSDIKQEQEAAGAKKFLRNLRCISCDKNAFMETNLKIITNARPFPCKPSIKPYLTFKMDHIRDKKIRQRKKCINLEKVMSANSEKYKYGLIEIMPKNYFCNRYSGGNHTIVSPQRRVTLQKATKYFGMCSDVNVQTIEGVVEGTDGRIYRGRWFIE
ncbi:PREDICTED: uncharacterized protein LOC105365834 [Ceratosolen solmsi marchali]|uniref:Uncharacterized protein LOC105365834 n=1 Tax=Ceratosolen solmsi marchali TaxID=326594 RepID=A0AAJ7DZR3_9HYME|nr:PREDICTED: uncharacterized protein LOC105365834 [Ceratosolen solmsi marchali]